jgi:hypothetical protein
MSSQATLSGVAVGVEDHLAVQVAGVAVDDEDVEDRRQAGVMCRPAGRRGRCGHSRLLSQGDGAAGAVPDAAYAALN